PEGVRYLGFVDRLDPLYADAGVVISPLTGGSGLKIKLIEALAHGKACVATSVTLQGVEEEAAHAVAVADTPEAFASSVVELLSSEPRRIELGRRALAVVRASFSAERSQGEFVRWLAEGGTA
ncbi:MAG: glycosyltransferase, partial [Caulobacteraceae bacterium]